MKPDVSSFHESLRREEAVQGPSDRSFGLTFAVVFALIGGASWLLDGAHALAWLGGAAVFLILALAAPGILAPLNRAWMKLGLLLHKIIQPVILALLYFVAITPVALLARLTGHDPLRLRFERQATSYWIERRPPGPDPQSLRNQF